MEPNKKNEEHEFTNPYKSTCHIEKMGLRKEKRKMSKLFLLWHPNDCSTYTCHKEVYQL